MSNYTDEVLLNDIWSFYFHDPYDIKLLEIRHCAASKHLQCSTYIHLYSIHTLFR